MKIEEYIGKIVRVTVTGKNEKCYIAKEIKNGINVYIKNEDYFEEEGIIGTTERCIILDKINDSLIGVLLTNKKFYNDIKKIDNKLSKKANYNNIKDIYLMERLKINGIIKGLYLVDEGDIGRYYLDMQEIGIYNKKIKENNILFKERTIDDEIKCQIKDIVQSIDLSKKEISLIEEQKKEKNIIEKALGIKCITKIASIDLNEKIYEKEQYEQQQNLIKQMNKFNNSTLKQKNTIKDVNIKQEMDTYNKITDFKTIGQILEKEGKLPKNDGKEYVKLGIIESDQRDNLVDKNGEKAKVNTTRYSFVAIARDGSVMPLELEQDYQEGNHPSEINYQVTREGTVKKGAVLSRYKIGNGTLAINNGKYGEIKAYHSPRKTIGGKGVEGNKSLDRELETNQVWDMKKEERDLAEEYGDGYRSVEDSYQEAKLHEDENGKIIDEAKMRTKDIDGEKNTKTHIHDNVDYNKLAVKWGYYKDGEPNYNKAKEIFEEKRKQNPQKETKEIIKIVTDELEEEFEHNNDSRR